jgi:hypothetical protein
MSEGRGSARSDAVGLHGQLWRNFQPLRARSRMRSIAVQKKGRNIKRAENIRGGM